MTRLRTAAELAGSLLLLAGLTAGVMIAGPPVVAGLWLCSLATRRRR